MYDKGELLSRLTDVLIALERIPVRFQSINEPDAFISDEQGREHLDSICMILLAVGEALKQVDHKTHGEWRRKYPQLPWTESIGMRNVIAHDYFDIDHEQVFSICQNDIPQLTEAVRFMINDLA